MKDNHITLLDDDKDELQTLLSKGVISARTQRRGYALQLLDKGYTYQEVANQLNASYPSVLGWAAKYRESRLKFLKDKARSGRPIGFNGEERAKITALACSTPPNGYARWSLRLLSDRMVELELVETISHSSVGSILKKMNFNHIANDNGV
jgi:putative transposase